MFAMGNNDASKPTNGGFFAALHELMQDRHREINSCTEYVEYALRNVTLTEQDVPYGGGQCSGPHSPLVTSKR
jgi:hypothetical protein